jgi:hypothetical protein
MPCTIWGIGGNHRLLCFCIFHHLDEFGIPRVYKLAMAVNLEVILLTSIEFGPKISGHIWTQRFRFVDIEETHLASMACITRLAFRRGTEELIAIVISLHIIDHPYQDEIRRESDNYQ